MELISYNHKSLILPESSNIGLYLSAAQSVNHYKRGFRTSNIIRFALSQSGMFFFSFCFSSQSVPHLQQALGISKAWSEGWL